MRGRRGLTLIEVLAATVLLVIMASTCIPLFRGAMATVRETSQGAASYASFEELSDLADAFMIDPAAFGVSSVGEIDRLELPWPEMPDRPTVLVVQMTGGQAVAEHGGGDDDDADQPHAWVSFTWNDWSVHRWTRLPTEQEAGDDGSGVDQSPLPGPPVAAVSETGGQS